MPALRPLRPARRRSPWALALGLLLGAIALWSLATFAQLPISAIARDAQPSTPQQWLQASFPVEGFQTYTSPFGYRRDPYTGGRRFHYGLDLAAPMGSFIRNWWQGQVVDVSDHTSCGTAITIRSGQWNHMYCHMQGRVVQTGGDRVLVDEGGGLRLQVGQTVRTGERIGRVGMTGRTTGPHLHWGLKFQNEWVDPGLVLQAMYSSQRAARQSSP